METKTDYDWYCMECRKKFRTVAAAERAMRRGCSCGGVDIEFVANDYWTIRAMVEKAMEKGK